MKRVILFFVLIITVSVSAQNTTVEAFRKSYVYESEYDYAKAISSMASIVDGEKKYNVNLRLGWLYYLSGDFIKSETYYRKSIELAPESIEARLGLVYPLSKLNSWDKVIEVYKSILSVDENHTSTHYQLAYIYYVRKMYTEAITHLNKVLKLYPFDYDSNLLIGATYLKTGQIKEAKYHYTLALEYNPSNTELETVIEGL